MRKIVSAIAAILLVVFGASMPAQASTYKTTVSISVPKFAAAGITMVVDVTVCSLASRSATSCDLTSPRLVTLFANKKKVATAATVYGVASVLWAPAAAGKYSLTASAAAISGYPSVSSVATSAVIAKKTTKTTLSVKYCDSISCESTPITMSFDDKYAQISGLLGTAANAKGRKAHLQYVNAKNLWETLDTKTTARNTEFNQYSADFDMNYDSTDYCINGDETYDWVFRVMVDGTAKYAPIASPGNIVRFDCGGGGASDSGISFSDDYSDIVVDSAFDNVPDITVDVMDPFDVGYEVDTFYCRSGCSLDENWILIDSANSVGDDSLTLSADWGEGTGSYSLQVQITPDDGSSAVSGDVYTVIVN